MVETGSDWNSNPKIDNHFLFKIFPNQWTYENGDEVKEANISPNHISIEYFPYYFQHTKLFLQCEWKRSMKYE